MKSLAVIVPELLPVPPVQGGAVEHWVHEVTGRLAQRGWPITVISRPAEVAGTPGIRYLGIPWTRAERFLERCKAGRRRVNPMRVFAKVFNVWRYSRRVAAAVSEFDIIYLHNEPNVLAFIKLRPEQKLVLHMHNEHLSIPALRPIYRRALAKADVILCVSDYIRRAAVRHFPEHAARFRTIHNATDPQVFRPGEVTSNATLPLTLDPLCQYVLYAGRLVADKGVHVLIEAFRAVLIQHPRARLIVTGSSFFQGAARTRYQENLATLAAAVGHAIEFTGFMPHEVLQRLYRACVVVVVPSVWQDPAPLVVLEAMASGACVIASAVGGIPEMIEAGRTGILVPPGDVTALSAAISRALADPGNTQALAAAGRAHIVARHDVEQLVNELDLLFRELQ